MRLFRTSAALLWSIAIGCCSISAFSAPSFMAFESASVRPMAMSPDGSTLYVTNTPDNTVEVFSVVGDGNLTALGSIPVGLEPVAIAARNNNEIWVVNHLSDSVSVIDSTTASVVRTLLVGDEPRDIVFASGNAFVTTAHRGQHRSHSSVAAAFDDLDGDPELFTSGTPRADIWVFNPANLGATLGGTPTKVIELFGDTPRGLAVSADGGTVYAAVFNSGNQTSVIQSSVMCLGYEDTPSGFARFGNSTLENRAGNEPCIAGNIPANAASSSPNGLSGKQLPMGRPLPSTSASGENQPWEGMIVKYDQASGQWLDSRGLNYSNAIRFTLPDQDVFAIDAATLNQVQEFSHVGTTLFNMAVNPLNGKIYVANQDAQNHIRFEGPGLRGGSTTQGNIAHAQITVIDPVTATVTPRHLNTHIDYSQLKAPASVRQHSISTPMEMQVSSDGSTLYVAALGSDKVAVYNTADLENGTLDPTLASANHIPMAGGPQGLLLNEIKNRLYVLTRFDNSVKVVNASTGSVQQVETMFNPEPASLQAGRFMLYNADRTSSNGESSCAGCHVFGDMDHMTWNLGNPDAGNSENLNPFPFENIATLSCDLGGNNNDDGCFFEQLLNGNGNTTTIAALKGPMNTQTMRGMSTHGHMHWRADRVNGYFGSQDGRGFSTADEMESLDEELSFKNFIVAFEGLLGLDVDLDGGVGASNKSAARIALENDVQKFADFMLQVQLQPNPIRPLNGSHSSQAQIGDAFFDGPRRSDGLESDFGFNGPEADGQTCESCHSHDTARGFFGSDGKVSTGGEFQILKAPHFRNLYQKVGMFGLPSRNGFLPSLTDAHQGDQIRGFGFLHDGATDDLFNFLGGGVFDDGDETCAQEGYPSWAGCQFNDGQSVGIPDDTVRRGLVQYLMEFDSDLAPVVGQQITLSNTATNAMFNRLSFLESRAQLNFVSKILGTDVKECDLVARGVVNGEQRGYLYTPGSDSYRSDLLGETTLTKSLIRSVSQTVGNALTFTCVPPGSGVRMALDRDLNGTLNCDEAGVSCTPGGGGDPTTVTVELHSAPAQDGYVRESFVGAGTGGQVKAGNAGGYGLRIGDDRQNRRYRAFVGFDLSSIPANATINSATLVLNGGVTKGLPFTTYGNARIDLATPYFGSSVSLQTADWQSGAGRIDVGSISTAQTTTTIHLSNAALNDLSAQTNMQLRILFASVVDGDGGNDRVGWYSAENGSAENRPSLVVEYVIP